MTSRRRRTKRPALLATLGAATAITALFLSQIPTGQGQIGPIPESEIRMQEGELVAASLPCPPEGVTCIPSDITIAYDTTAPAGFEGVVSAGDPACVGGRTVDLFQGTVGPLSTPAGTTTTDEDGAWHIDVAEPPAAGTWTARVAGEPAGGYETSLFCEEDSASMTITHGNNQVAFILNGEPFDVNLGSGPEVCREDREVTIYQGGTAGQKNGTPVGSATVTGLEYIPVSPLVPNTDYHAEMEPRMAGDVYCLADSSTVNSGNEQVTTLTLSYNSAQSRFTAALDPSSCRVSTRRISLQEANDGQSNWTEVANVAFGTGASVNINYTKLTGKDYRVITAPWTFNENPRRYCTAATSNVVT